MGCHLVKKMKMCVSHDIDKISLEISVMKLQEAILFGCLCFSTCIVKYFIAVFFCGECFVTVLQFAKLMLMAEIAFIALPYGNEKMNEKMNMGKFYRKN